jgi:inositol-phosphate phosphatase / L-galactose 1-phosphate phosphatase / histidinol-phosphatase
MGGADQLEVTAMLAFAQGLADAARPIAMGYFRQPVLVETKADQSPVTIADRMIESEMRRLISERFPGHGVFGEEFAEQAGRDYTWVLDPIDGTRSFITGMPLFGTLIALMHGDDPMLGVVDFPALGERWVGRVAHGTLCNGKPVRASDCRTLQQARCYCTSPDMFDLVDGQRFEALSRRVAMRRFGGDCYGYALLASGHCDLVVEAGLKPYDYLPLVPVIEGAGGRITDWQGRRLGFESDGRVVAAANEELLRQAIDALR